MGVRVALGQDCCLDPWYGLGSADMLEVAHMAVHATPMMSREDLRWSFEAVTTHAAAVMGLEGYGLAVGCHADFVLLQADDPIDAIRLRANRLAVVRRGRVISRTPPQYGRARPARPAIDTECRPSKLLMDSSLL